MPQTKQIIHFILVYAVLALGVDADDYAKATDVNTSFAKSTVLRDVTFPAVASEIAEFCYDSIDPNSVHTPFDYVFTHRGISTLPSDFIIKRAGLNSAVNENQVPARIIYPKSIAEVQDAVNTTVRLREEYGGQICVRGSGSGNSGLSWSCDNGTVLDMSKFRVFNQLEEGLDIQFGANDMQVTIGASTTLGALHQALAAHNRALPLGKWGELNVIGFTIGGGFSEIARRYGLACDWVTSADLIIADGSLVTVKTGDDLLWHVKGGGGGVGVITSLTFNLIPYLPNLIAYSGTWSSTAASEIIHWWSNHELNTTISNIVDNVGMRLVLSSSIPGLVEMNGLYLIPDNESKDEALRQLIKFLDPINVSALYGGIKFNALTWAEYNYHEFVKAPKTGNLCRFWGNKQSHFMSRLTDRNIAVIIDRVAELMNLPIDDSSTRMVIINAWGGAIARKDFSNLASFWGRAALFEVNIEVEYDARVRWNQEFDSPERDSASAFHWARWAEGWIERTSTELCRYANPMCQFGFVNNENKAVHAPHLYGPHLAQLRSIKDVFDPSSLFVAKTDYEDSFSVPMVKEQVATLDTLIDIDESSASRVVRDRPLVIGYAPLYENLPHASELEQVDVLTIFAATTLIFNESSSSLFSCNAECDIGFADASYEKFENHTKIAKQFVQGAVLLAFGGAAMNPCYELCFSGERVKHMATQLADLVSDIHLDGIDFNIEIQPNPTSIKFIEDLTMATHIALTMKNNSKRWILSHAPIAHHLDHGGIWSDENYMLDDYLGLFTKFHRAGLLSFIFIQFYNSFPAVYVKDDLMEIEALIGYTTRLRRSLPAEKLILGICSGPGCDKYTVKGDVVGAVWRKMRDLYQNTFGGIGLWWLSPETMVDFFLEFDGGMYPTPSCVNLDQEQIQTSSSISLMLVIILAVSILLILATAVLAPDKSIIEGVWSVRDQKDIISSTLPGLIPVFIPAYKESEAEMRATMANFKECNVTNIHVRAALRLYFIVDNTRDSVPVQTLLEVCELDSQDYRVENGAPVLFGTCYNIKCKIVLKGETSLWQGGKRHSAVLFTKLVKGASYRDANEKPWAALCLDSDVVTYPHSIERLVVDLLLSKNCAITCGNIAPSENNKSIAVHLQKAEYHLQNRIAKNAEALFGCVSCCPGAFMCIKFSVFDNVLNVFVGQKMAPDSCFFRNAIDLGEDRYLTSVMLTLLGEQTTFCMSALCATEVPGDFNALITQRRRWFNSTFCNDIFLLGDILFQFLAMLPGLNKALYKTSIRRGSMLATVTENSNLADILRRKDQKCTLPFRLPFIFISALIRAISSVLNPGFAIILMMQISLFAQTQSLIDHRLLRWIINGGILFWAIFIFITFVIIGKNKKSWLARSLNMWIEIQTGIAVMLMYTGFAAILIYSDGSNHQIVLASGIGFLVVIIASIVQVSDYRAGYGPCIFFSFVVYYIVGIPFFGFIQPLYAFAQIDNFTWGTRETCDDKNSKENIRIGRSILLQKLFCWFSILSVNGGFFGLVILLPAERLGIYLAGFVGVTLTYFLVCGFARSLLLQYKSYIRQGNTNQPPHLYE